MFFPWVDAVMVEAVGDAVGSSFEAMTVQIKHAASCPSSPLSSYSMCTIIEQGDVRSPLGPISEF